MTLTQALTIKGSHLDLSEPRSVTRHHAERWWRGETDLLFRGKRPASVRVSVLREARATILAAKGARHAAKP